MAMPTAPDRRRVAVVTMVRRVIRVRKDQQMGHQFSVLQIAHQSRECGIDLFAGTLHDQMECSGVRVETVSAMPIHVNADIVLLQYHDELFSDGEVFSISNCSPVPLVLFAHSEVAGAVVPNIDGLMAMCDGMFSTTDKPTLIFPHPAWTPTHTEDRQTLLREFGMPVDRKIVATHGFLKFERQFVEIISALIPHARRNSWLVKLLTSPWRLDSPGLVSQLESLSDKNPDHFGFDYAFIDTPTLNRRLQACDLLWCWTAAPSSPYASGVISDQYASGTRIFAADKMQHNHVLNLPNVVTGPNTLEGFINGLIAEAGICHGQRHDPSAVSWEGCVSDIVTYLRRIAADAHD